MKKILLKDNLNVRDIQTFLKEYKKEIDKISDDKAHLLDTFIVFCLYKISIDSLKN